ncbi:MAG: copper resistance protein CopC [Acidimicrobiia bacterium]
MTSKRLLALGALVVALVVAGAMPAFAHTTLLTTEPQPGGKFDKSPPVISLRFSEPVEVALGGIRLFDGDSNRVDVGAAEHPNGDGNRVQSSIPKLDDGTYVVTWRVTSADAHPVQGAFTFQVGTKGFVKNADVLVKRLLAKQGGSIVVGVVYAIDRVAIFATLALLIGGIVFLSVVFPAGRDSRRARIIVWAGWIGAGVATLAGIALEGVYGAALPLTKVFDPSVGSDVLETRYGRVSVVRLVLLLLAYPLLRMLLSRRPAAEHPLPKWWLVAAGLLSVGLSLTPGLAGHAAAGDYTGLAIPADAIHVLAMACWLGGLVLLLVVVLVRTDPDELRQGINRYSALALGAIVALVITGSFQAWRQVGSFSALRDTDYGNLLIAKLVAFAALIVAAAFSREIVNRRFRMPLPDNEADVPIEVPVAVGAVSGGRSDVGPPPLTMAPGANGFDDEWEEGDDETEVRRLRRSVFVEVVIAFVVLAITALLVNAAPARSVQTAPISMTLKSGEVWVDVVIAPGVAGGNDIHLTALPVGNTITNVQDMTVQLTRPGADLPPFDVPLRKLGPGHYVASLYDIPYSGGWRMIVRVRLGEANEVVLTGKFTLR